MEALESDCRSSFSTERSRVEYLSAVRQNPALALLGFYCTRKFRPGNEIVHFIGLSTAKACAASPTLAHLPALRKDVAAQWIFAWRRAGFLEEEEGFN